MRPLSLPVSAWHSGAGHGQQLHSCQEMLPFASVAAVTGPADVSMGEPCHAATRSAPVFRSGCTASHIFFFCTCKSSPNVSCGFPLTAGQPRCHGSLPLPWAGAMHLYQTLQDTRRRGRLAAAHHVPLDILIAVTQQMHARTTPVSGLSGTLGRGIVNLVRCGGLWL